MTFTNLQWITTSAASEESGVPKRTIIAAINRGDLPAEKLPGLTGSFLIDPAHLEVWLRSRKQPADVSPSPEGAPAPRRRVSTP